MVEGRERWEGRVASPEHGLCGIEKRCFVLPVLAAIFSRLWHSESVTQ